jgi:hypothetical protein
MRHENNKTSWIPIAKEKPPVTFHKSSDPALLKVNLSPTTLPCNKWGNRSLATNSKYPASNQYFSPG